MHDGILTEHPDDSAVILDYGDMRIFALMHFLQNGSSAISPRRRVNIRYTHLRCVSTSLCARNLLFEESKPIVANNNVKRQSVGVRENSSGLVNRTQLVEIMRSSPITRSGNSIQELVFVPPGCREEPIEFVIQFEESLVVRRTHDQTGDVNQQPSYSATEYATPATASQ
jgi:hypothetical protein